MDRPVLNPRRQTILLEIKQNPYITKQELSEIIGVSTTAIDNNMMASRFLLNRRRRFRQSLQVWHYLVLFI